MAFQFLAMDAAVLNSEINMRESAAELAALRQVDSPSDLEHSTFIQLYRLTPKKVYTLVDSIESCLERKTISALSAENQPPKKDSKSSAKQPQKTQKKKEGGGGGKAKKKKWSKGKVRDKLNNQILFDKATYDKLYKEVPQYKLITPSVVSERLKIRGSLAKRALVELRDKGLIKQVVQHHSQVIYTRATKGDDA